MDCIPYIIIIQALYGPVTGEAVIDPCTPYVEGYIDVGGSQRAIEGSLTYKGLIFALDDEGEAYYFKPVSAK